eukprot:jgi/Bigna1/146477/aug1.115_g21185
MNLSADTDPKILHLAANSPMACPTGEQECDAQGRGEKQPPSQPKNPPPIATSANATLNLEHRSKHPSSGHRVTDGWADKSVCPIGEQECGSGMGGKATLVTETPPPIAASRANWSGRPKGHPVRMARTARLSFSREGTAEKALKVMTLSLGTMNNDMGDRRLQAAEPQQHSLQGLVSTLLVINGSDCNQIVETRCNCCNWACKVCSRQSVRWNGVNQQEQLPRT